VISYNAYWIAVIIGFLLMRYRETKGHLPFMKAKAYKDQHSPSPTSSGVFEHKSDGEKTREAVTAVPARTVSE